MNFSTQSQLLSDSPVPLYVQLKELLRTRVLDGTYPPLARMPSESELGEVFGVSRITVRQALGDLQKEGLIFKIHGKGTFVAKPKPFQNVSSLQGLGEALSSAGHEVHNIMQSLKPIAAVAQVAERLGVMPGTLVTELRRVRVINREPVSLEITYVSTRLGERLAAADLTTRDVFLIMENDLDITLGHADLAIDAVQADAQMAQALGIMVGAPIMRIERLTHDSDGVPLDFEYLYYRGDAFQYRLRIDR